MGIKHMKKSQLAEAHSEGRYQEYLDSLIKKKSIQAPFRGLVYKIHKMTK